MGCDVMVRQRRRGDAVRRPIHARRLGVLGDAPRRPYYRMRETDDGYTATY